MSAKLASPSATRSEFTLERLSRLFEMDRAGIVWRHDVDYSMTCALKMSEFERDRGIVATYYIRSRFQYFGDANYALSKALSEIQKNGHQLGVHVDLGLPRDAEVTALQMRQACVQQCFTDHDFVFDHGMRVSLHAPPTDALFRQIPGFDNALAPWWRNRYVGDSRGSFRFGEPEEFLSAKTFVQINLHPEWWFLPEAEADELRKQEEAKP